MMRNCQDLWMGLSCESLMLGRKLTAKATAGRHEEDRAMTKRMGRVICDITISADGYSAGLNQTEERPFGDDGGDGSGDKLHAWMFETPEENRAEVDQMTAAKAFIMGRNMFGPVRGEWDRQRLVGRRSAVPRPG